MSKDVKAALLSGLVFPGLGHFYLKHQARGALLAVAAAAALYVLLSNIMARAEQIAAQIQRGEIAPDIATISQAVSSQAGGDDTLLSIAAIALPVVWLLGIIDAFRAGRSLDRDRMNP